MTSIRRFDICQPKPKGPRESDGVWWHRLGSASENDRGQISLFFDSLPIGNWDGRAMLFEQRPRDERAQNNERTTQSNRGRSDDDIPL
jgi:hypothetical protein